MSCNVIPYVVAGVLQYVAVHKGESASLCVATSCSVLQNVLQMVLQCCCSVLQCCVLQCVACCSVLQHVAACCSDYVLHFFC